jgi:hypothetical protein
MILPALMMLQLAAAGSVPPVVPQAPPPPRADSRDPAQLPADQGRPPHTWVGAMMADLPDDQAVEADTVIAEPVSATGNTALWVDLPALPAAQRNRLVASKSVGELK